MPFTMLWALEELSGSSRMAGFHQSQAGLTRSAALAGECCGTEGEGAVWKWGPLPIMWGLGCEQSFGVDFSVPAVLSSLHMPICTCTEASPTMGTRLLPPIPMLLILLPQSMMILLFCVPLSSSFYHTVSESDVSVL